MLSEADDLHVEHIDDTFYLLIPSRFPPVPLFKRISGGSDDVTARVADLYNPRLREKKRLLGSGGGEAGTTSPRLQNWNHAPFTYSNPEGSWFFDRFVPCLEMSRDKQTALAVSIAKRERFLKRTGEAPIGLDARMLGRRVAGSFLDARKLSVELPLAQRREIGKAILARAKSEDLSGVLFRSPERPSGTRICVLDGDVLDRAVQGEHFRYSWDGERVESLYAFNNSGGDQDNLIYARDLATDAYVLPW